MNHLATLLPGLKTRTHQQTRNETEYRVTLDEKELTRLIVAAVAQTLGLDRGQHIESHVTLTTRDLTGTAGIEHVAKVTITVDHAPQAAPEGEWRPDP